MRNYVVCFEMPIVRKGKWTCKRKCVVVRAKGPEAAWEKAYKHFKITDNDDAISTVIPTRLIINAKYI